MNINVSYRSPSHKYDIIVQRGLLKNAGKVICEKVPSDKYVIITNHIVKRLWYNTLKTSFDKNGMKYSVITIPSGEQYKNIDTYHTINSKMLSYKIDRKSALITFGGGVIGDLGGFVASTYMRGINLIHIPTTLIAQIDSSIGGKLAIDHPSAKNIIGAFYDPKIILTDPEVLNTLSDKEFYNGLFEAIKIGLANNPELFYFILKNIKRILKRQKNIVNEMIASCIREKVKIIRKDPFDKNIRTILNLGHTFGHALETAGGYKNISHGEAVGYGILLAMHLSSVLNLIDTSYFSEPYSLIEGLLKKRNFGKLNRNKIWATITHDKKVENNRVRFVLLKAIGRSAIAEVDKRDFFKALEAL